jgi:hypothetical protein
MFWLQLSPQPEQATIGIMVIKLGHEISKTITGAALKEVCCEQCEYRYQYQIERKGTGESFAWLFISTNIELSEAETRAARDLRRQLRKGHDLVPCPMCGFIQQEMVEQARENAYEWLFFFVMVPAFFCIYTLPIAAGAAGPRIRPRDQAIALTATICLGLIAFGAACLHSFLKKRYNPNHWPIQFRLDIARKRCIPHGQLPDKSPTPTNLPEQQYPEAADDSSEQESVSSADKANAAQFALYAVPALFLAVILVIIPGVEHWRALAALGLASVFLLFSVIAANRRS